MEGDRLILSGRAKNVIVLETGKNVYPEEVEWELSRIPGIEELLVYEAERQGAPVVAVKIYPKWSDLKEKGITTPDRAIDYLWEEIKAHNENLAPFKRIKYRDVITLVDEPFEKSVKMDIKRYKYSNR
jgi:long-chain acyl-CoA synthetase